MIAEQFGRLAATLRYCDLPAEVVDMIKWRVLDLLGAAIAGYRTGNARESAGGFLCVTLYASTVSWRMPAALRTDRGSAAVIRLPR